MANHVYSSLNLKRNLLIGTAENKADAFPPPQKINRADAVGVRENLLESV